MTSYRTDYDRRKSIKRRKYKAKGIMNLCVVCSAQVPDSRFRKETCDTTCERAKKNKRTRGEQLWVDMHK